ncbi:Succinate dehydrogenase ubiquinone flavoprotein subunit 1, mitochondrial [Hondaea fermentalgiana]|uniref:fumarate reductase (NADH) n=1 Tax=Hondaea fermentalgiana TaxID=2315210 RepID=A0A2R5GL66_9STRA|nr:Succinate dehydrogenase ubiquinone flavoprotein subunit 1, mitochondrial [Hondaea fermentalgiana]|eukprot:GBG31049.1 Succinate dehydrogenase ubiquinone flavoprotein subunit 1, mitochondrial [Hondaea fermentalgiana]
MIRRRRQTPAASPAWRTRALGALVALALAVCSLSVVSTTASAGKHESRPLRAKVLFEDEVVCNSEAIRTANSDYLLRLLEELTNTTYFRLFRVQLDGECPLDAGEAQGGEVKKPEEPSCGFGDDEDDDHGEGEEAPEPLCNLKPSDESLSNPFFGGGGGGGFGAPGFGNPVDKTLSKHEDSVVSQAEEDCDDESLPAFWTNLCAELPFNDSTMEYVNLQLNPEQFTGYNGSKVWDAIYGENCFEIEEIDMCYEERFLYRMLSGLHSSINLHISEHYKPPVPGKRDRWERDLVRFQRQFEGHPERFKNLEFAFVVLLRAVRRATPTLREFNFATGESREDQRTNKLVSLFLDSFVLRSCQTVFEAFDESLLFVNENGPQVSTMANLKRRFKDIFHNISNIFNCIRCQRCRLHGKLQLLGIGTAMKMLLLPEHLIKENLSREEVVALFNTMAKFSEAIEIHQNMKDAMLASKASDATSAPAIAPSMGAGPISMSISNKESLQLLQDRALAIVSGAVREGELDEDMEDALVDALLDGDEELMILAKHFALENHDVSFIRHAVRRLGQVDVQGPTKPDAVVIGAGLSGLTAALSILDRGGSVVLIDKEGGPGGNSAKASSGINGIDETSLTKLNDSIAQFKEDMVIGSGRPSFATNPLVDVLTKGSADALAWLRSRVGLALDEVGQLGGHSRPRTWRPSTGLAGSELIVAVNRAVKSYEESGKLEFRRKTQVTEILVNDAEDDVALRGVRCKNLESGETFDLDASAVVIATGGYGFHRGSEDSFLLQHRPDLARFGTTNGKFATGDGILLAQAVGADTVDIDQVQVHPTAFVDPKDRSSPVKTLAAELLRGVGAVMLDASGRRFVNELGTRKYVSEHMIAHDPSADGQPEFLMVLSASVADRAPKHIPMYMRKGLMWKVDSVEALAETLGAEVATVRQTLEDFDRTCTDMNAYPDPFNRTVCPDTPLATDAPFYVGYITPAVHYSMGGLRIDSQGRTVNNVGVPTAGGRLYAVGEVVGGIHGKNRLGGNALTECAVFGLHVGAHVPIQERTKPKVTSGRRGETRSISSSSKTSLKSISMDELKQHNTPEDCWVAIDGKVYDLTLYAEDHPGGREAITSLAGTDGTKTFMDVHTPSLLEDLDPIGIFASEP